VSRVLPIGAVLFGVTAIVRTNDAPGASVGVR
jgi:hypothetical protein